MYSFRRLRSIRELDLLLFGGSQESAEQMFEPDSQGHYEMRVTGKPHPGRALAKNPYKPICTYRLNFKTGEVTQVEQPGGDNEPSSAQITPESQK